MEENKDIPEIDLHIKTIHIEAKTYALKSKWHFLNVNHCHLVTKYKIIYWIYKIWWKYFPPEPNFCYSIDAMEELEKQLTDEIEKTKIRS
jgi:hypothetical protein